MGAAAHWGTCLAGAVGLEETDIAHIRKTTINRLSSFDPAANPETAEAESPLGNHFGKIPPLYTSELGSITRVDPKVNPLMPAMALQRTLMRPGVLRIPHWYTSGDVLFFVLRGQAFFTMMNDEGKVYHTLLKPGDLVSIPVGNFHGVLNAGQDELEIYEAFTRVDDIQEITLANGARHFNAGTIAGATRLDKAVVQKLLKAPEAAYMTRF